MKLSEIAPGIGRLPIAIANAYFVGKPGASWTLVDSGVPGKAATIRKAAESRYGSGARPSCIVLTHGHMDHAGSARELAEAWDVPIYAHHLEMPYLTGKSAFPPKDPTVGGAMAFLCRFLNTKPVDLRPHIRELPPDGEIPGMPDWQWIHTPGHAPGQVSLWHPGLRALLAGDAFTTVDVDSALAFITQDPEINRPPAPLTYDWQQARESVHALAALEPFTIGCGHGRPISGPNVAADLKHFAFFFQVPAHGRYIPVPAQTDERGIRFVPPPEPDPLPKVIAAAGISVAIGAAVSLNMRKEQRYSIR